MRIRNQSQRRPGSVLVYFALVVFVLLAVAALVIDLGFALLTRQQLQTAADTAALEGLRARDDPTVTDAVRRENAATLAAAVFHDDLKPNDVPPPTLGAGPVLAFSGGIDTGTSFEAAQNYTVRSAYQPDLQTNTGNDPTGDLVSGTYVAGGSHQENPDYSRGDFVPDPADSATPGGAFLVRLRWTGEPATAGVSSPGPPLPYLFARGSLLNPQLKATGIRVRGTAIAAGRPAMSVGRPNPDPQLRLVGNTPFVLRRSVWEDNTILPVDQAVPLSIDPTGNVTVNRTADAGYAFTAAPVVAVGQSATGSAASDMTQFKLFLYVPVVQAFAGSSGARQRIVGFGRADIQPAGAQFQITKRADRIAPANASAALLGGLDPDLQADPSLLNQVLAAHALLQAALMSPALVR